MIPSDLARSTHVLTAIGDVVLAKRWTLGDGGVPKCRSYDQAKQFTSREEPVSSIYELGKLLARLERDPRSCVVRARLRDGVDPEAPHRRLLHAEGDDPATLEDQARAWVCLDVDDVPMPAGLSVVEDPDAVIEAVVRSHLPAELRDVTCAWQFSSSAGMPGSEQIVKCHAWYWLARPLDCDELTRWAKGAGLEGIVDLALLRPVQVHYTARPVFEGGAEDPLRRRSGMLRRDRDVARLEPPPKETRAARAVPRATARGGLPAPDALAEAAGLLRASWPAEGTGYHDALAALVGWLLTAGWDAEDVEAFAGAAVPPRRTPRPNELTEWLAATTAALAVGRPTTGWTRLAELVGEAAAEARAVLGLEPSGRPPPPDDDDVPGWVGDAGGYAESEAEVPQDPREGEDQPPPPRDEHDGGADRRADAEGQVEVDAAEAPWPPRQPLSSAIPAVPSLSAELVPWRLRPYLEDEAEHASLPVEMVAVPALVALGSVVGRKLAIEPTPGWTVVPNIWGGLVMAPGSKKTPALGVGKDPLGPLIARAREDHKRAAVRSAARATAIKAKIKHASKPKDGEVDEEELVRLHGELADCAVHERRYLTNDATVAALGELLRRNPRGLLVFRDELSGLLTGFDDPRRAGDREFYLEAWDGTHDFTIERIERGNVYLPALCLSLLGAIQPGKLRRYVRDACSGGPGADGLLQRVQLLVWPDRLPPHRRCNRPLDRAAREQTFVVFAALDGLTGEAIGATPNRSGIPVVRFDPDAQAAFDGWLDALEARLRGPALEPMPAFQAHLGKYRSLVPSLALLCHLADELGGIAVGVEHVRTAIAWVDFLEMHARKVFAPELCPGLASAELLASKLEAHAVEHGRPLRELYRSGWEGLKVPERVRDGLAVLEGLGWCRVVRRPPAGAQGGRPTEVVALHPELRV